MDAHGTKDYPWIKRIALKWYREFQANETAHEWTKKLCPRCSRAITAPKALYCAWCGASLAHYVPPVASPARPLATVALQPLYEPPDPHTSSIHKVVVPPAAPTPKPLQSARDVCANTDTHRLTVPPAMHDIIRKSNHIQDIVDKQRQGLKKGSE